MYSNGLMRNVSLRVPRMARVQGAIGRSVPPVWALDPIVSAGVVKYESTSGFNVSCNAESLIEQAPASHRSRSEDSHVRGKPPIEH